MAPLLRLKDNSCHIDESERVLKDAHKYSELVILYEKKGLHQKGMDCVTFHCLPVSQYLMCFNSADVLLLLLLSIFIFPAVFFWGTWADFPNWELLGMVFAGCLPFQAGCYSCYPSNNRLCIWKSRLSLGIKLKLYNICILPIMLYGSECWALI